MMFSRSTSSLAEPGALLRTHHSILGVFGERCEVGEMAAAHLLLIRGRLEALVRVLPHGTPAGHSAPCPRSSRPGICRPGGRGDRRPLRPRARTPIRPLPRSSRRRTRRVGETALASASDSRSWLQSISACRVCWRGSMVRSVPLSSLKRSFSRAASCSTGNVRTRAAASLDRERDAVEAVADGGDGGRIADRQFEIRAGRCSALDEQQHRFVLRQYLRLEGRAQVRDHEGGERQRRLARDMQRLAAGCEDLQVRARCEHLPREVRARMQQVLAVVEHEEDLAVGDMLRQRLGHRMSGFFLHPHRGGDGERHAARIA